MLSDEQIERYSRQIILPQVGGKGQEKLLSAKVLVHASGAVHAAALHYLAAAGVGTLGIFAEANDDILLALSSPQHTGSGHILTRLNPDCTIIVHQADAVRSPLRLVEAYDAVIADSAELHDACRQAHRPFVYAQVTGEEAWLAVLRGYEADAPCLRCTSQVLPVTAAVSPYSAIGDLFVGAQLATEAITYLLGLSPTQATQRLHFNMATFQCRRETVQKDRLCPVCRLGAGT